MAEHSTATVPRHKQRDLWSEAANQLSDDDKELIDFGNLKEGHVANSVLMVVTEQHDLCKKKEYSFKFRGKVINVRQVLGRVMKWIDKFKNVIAFGVSLDTSGHAALPWACVKFVLEVSVNEQIKLLASPP
jgi:hypothetical protein